MSYQTIQYRTDARVARVTLNRPERRNAISFELRSEFTDALDAAERDDSVSVVLIDGNGPAFCSSYDIAPGESGRVGKPEGWVDSEYFNSWTDQTVRSYVRDWLAIWDLLKPAVCKVHGYCLAGGTELMSMCDIVFVADDAVIGSPPMRGMATPATLVFPWKLNMAQAKSLQLTGNSRTGKQAAESGWVAKSFPADTLEEETMREVRALSSIAPDMPAANKAALNQGYELMGFRTALMQGWSWHALSNRLPPGAGDFARISKEQGLKAALEWRDGPFRDEGFRS